jgi:hypothetical protein
MAGSVEERSEERAMRMGSLLLVFLIACAGASPGPQVAPAPTASTKGAIDPSGEWEIRWDRSSAGWQPAIFNGTLDILRGKDHWDAVLHFRESGVKPVFSSMKVDGDRVDIFFHAPARESGAGETEIEIAGWIRDGRLLGEMRWADTIQWTPCDGRRTGEAIADTPPDPAPAISGVILSTDGSLAAAVVVAVVAGDLRSDARTDDSGRFTVNAPAAGDALLYAYKDGKSARLQGSFAPTKTVTLKLVDPGTIEGTFSGPSTSATVSGWLGPGKVAAVLPGIWGRMATIRGDHFKFDGVPAGELEVHLVVGESPASAAHALVHVDPGKTATVSLDPKPATASVTGTARSATMHQALSIEAFLLMPDGSPEAWFPVSGGHFSFGGRTPGDRVLLVVSRGFKPRRMPVTLAADRDSDLGDILLEPISPTN